MLFVSRYLRHIVDQSIELVGPGVLERGGHVFPVLPETRRLCTVHTRCNHLRAL